MAKDEIEYLAEGGHATIGAHAPLSEGPATAQNRILSQPVRTLPPSILSKSLPEPPRKPVHQKIADSNIPLNHVVTHFHEGGETEVPIAKDFRSRTMPVGEERRFRKGPNAGTTATKHAGTANKQILKK